MGGTQVTQHQTEFATYLRVLPSIEENEFVTRLSYNSHVIQSPFLDTISSRSCLVILLWPRGDASEGLAAGGEGWRQCAAGLGRWVRTGPCWAIRKGSVEKVSFEMNLEEVAGP